MITNVRQLEAGKTYDFTDSEGEVTRGTFLHYYDGADTDACWKEIYFKFVDADGDTQDWPEDELQGAAEICSK